MCRMYANSILQKYPKVTQLQTQPTAFVLCLFGYSPIQSTNQKKTPIFTPSQPLFYEMSKTFDEVGINGEEFSALIKLKKGNKNKAKKRSPTTILSRGGASRFGLSRRTAAR